EIDRLRRDGLDGCRDLFAGLDAWRIKTISPGIGECLQSADGLVEIGSVPDETFGARGEDNTTARLVDRIARCANALDRQIEVIERLVVVAGSILDRQARNASVDAKANVRRDFIGIIGVTTFEIRIDRDIRRLCNLAAVREHHVPGDVAIRVAYRMGVSGAGRGQGFESKSLQIAGAADIPWVWDNEAAALVQRSKAVAFFGDAHEAACKWAEDRQCLQRSHDCNIGVDLSGI